MATEADIQLLKIAVHRNSPLIYDNLGISVSMSEMPSAQDKQTVLSALQPRSRWGRILLWLQPKKRKKLLREYNYLDALVQVERTNYYLDKAMELMKDAK